MNIKHMSIQALICTVLLGAAAPSFARTDGGGKKSAQKAPSQQNNHGNCYYCWKDLSIDYTPSRHKYARKS